MAETESAMPSASGNAGIVLFSEQCDPCVALDSGGYISVHSALLGLPSSVLADTIALARSSTKAGDKLRVPLPNTTEAEVQLLLRAVYAWHPKELLSTLSKKELLELARICHRFAIEQLLTCVDEVRHLHALSISVSARLHVHRQLGTTDCCKSKIRKHAW